MNFELFKKAFEVIGILTTCETILIKANQFRNDPDRFVYGKKFNFTLTVLFLGTFLLFFFYSLILFTLFLLQSNFTLNTLFLNLGVIMFCILLVGVGLFICYNDYKKGKLSFEKRNHKMKVA